MAKKLAKTLCGLTVLMVAVGGVLAYLKLKEDRDSLDEDFDDFTDEFEDQESCAERTYTTLSRDGKADPDNSFDTEKEDISSEASPEEI